MIRRPPLVAPPPAAFYTCPGESHAIPRSVHLARLAAGFNACLNCRHREDQGLARISAAESSSARQISASATAMRLTPFGFRGRYLNQLTRRDLTQFSIRVAEQLWSTTPWLGNWPKQQPAPGLQAAPTSPTAERQNSSLTALRVVVGFDERTMSPDLAVGAVTGLRLSGCHVIDIGRVHQPLWSFAAARLKADAALWINGSESESSWCGCDVLGANGVPMPDDALNALRRFQDLPTGRLSRSAGSVELWNPLPDYLRELKGYFQALRPLRVRWLNATPLMRRLLEQSFAGLPCTLTFARRRTDGRDLITSTVEALNCGADEVVSREEVLLRDNGSSSSQNSNSGGQSNDSTATPHASTDWDLAIQANEAGTIIDLFDEQGRHVPSAKWIPWAAAATLKDPPLDFLPTMVDASGLPPSTEHWPSPPPKGWQRLTETSWRDFYLKVQQQQAAVGLDPQGQFWLGGQTPACDAILTCAAILRALSWSDAPLSVRLGQADWK